MANLTVFLDENCECPQEELLNSLYLNNPSQEPSDQLGFKWDNKSRMSKNVIDLRGYNYTMVSGSLTWKTSFHIAASTPFQIANSLTKRGFWITRVISNKRWSDWFNNDYSFEIWMMVLRQYNYTQIKNNVRNALKDVAIASSIELND